MKQKTAKIVKRKNSFVYFNEEGTNMGSINIATGKFVGATLCMMKLYEHLEAYKQTPEFLLKEKDRLKKSIQSSTEQFHKDLNQLEQINEKL